MRLTADSQTLRLKSKAITIVRPEDGGRLGSTSATDQEESDGRPAQSADRLKRQRHRGDGGDDVKQ